MECKVCGREIVGKDLICPSCGAQEKCPLSRFQVQERIVKQLVFGSLAAVFSAVAFLGISGAFIFGILFGIVAVVMGLIQRKSGCFSKTSFIIGLFGILLGIVRLIMIILEGFNA